MKINDMKINEIQRIGAINQYRNQHSKAGQSEGKGKRDEVHISSEAQQLLDAQAQAAAEERGQRIEELKQSVSSGSYYVEANKIAEKLLPYLK